MRRWNATFEKLTSTRRPRVSDIRTCTSFPYTCPDGNQSRTEEPPPAVVGATSRPRLRWTYALLPAFHPLSERRRVHDLPIPRRLSRVLVRTPTLQRSKFRRLR